MKKLTILILLFCGIISAQAQKTKADSIIGKWKYMGAMKSKSMIKIDPSKYHNAPATPKFEFIEFVKGSKTFSYNEKGKTTLKTTYKVSKDTVIIDKIKYQIKAVDKKNLTLYRCLYIVLINAEGKMEMVDEEQLSFIKIQ